MNAQLSLYDALVSVNIPADKARAVVAALEQEMTSVLATKSDIELLRQELQSQFGSLRQEFAAEYGSLRQELQSQVGSLRQESAAEYGSLRQELQSQVGSLRQEFASEHGSLRQELHSVRDSLKKDMLLLQHGMTIKLGLMMAVSMSLLFAGLKFG